MANATTPTAGPYCGVAGYTLEGLNALGSLDSLAYSLDSPLWGFLTTFSPTVATNSSSFTATGGAIVVGTPTASANTITAPTMAVVGSLATGVYPTYIMPLALAGGVLAVFSPTPTADANTNTINVINTLSGGLFVSTPTADANTPIPSFNSFGKFRDVWMNFIFTPSIWTKDTFNSNYWNVINT